ncbi:hypothetical protein [Nocardioides sambongensis]|uniref:hypothetical protein n=1 Tax=Nocardioides sambongensis TaxID=2589074 RepID=UPI00112E1899|nr:hypothetical protein [Nocardioides sambongensis]
MTDHEIPALLPPDQMPPVVDQASLEHLWRAMMGELGFTEPQVWVMVLRRGAARFVTKVEDVPLCPDPGTVATMVGCFQHLTDRAEDRLAFLYARPGGAALTPADLAWAHELSVRGDGWPVHLATDTVVRVVAMDDLRDAG